MLFLYLCLLYFLMIQIIPATTARTEIGTDTVMAIVDWFEPKTSGSLVTSQSVVG